MSKVIIFIKRNWDWMLVAVLTLVYIVVMSRLSMLRHEAFASNFDLANMDQTVWNTAQGRIFTLTGQDETVSRFMNHADLILILLAPIYWIWADVRALLIVQSMALGLAAVPIYLLGRLILNNKLAALAIVAAYLLNPGVQWTNIYDFHPVTLAVPMMLAAVYAIYQKNWKWYWIWVVLAMTTKEQIPLLVVMLGIAILVMRRSWKVGLLSMVIGAAWFGLMVFVAIPSVRPEDSHWAWAWYQFGSNENHGWWQKITIEADLLKSKMTNVHVREFFWPMMVKPYGYLPILGLPWVAVAGPDIFINLMSSQAQMQTIYFHYDSGVTPFLVMGVIWGLGWLGWLTQKITGSSRAKQLVVLGLCGWMVAVAVRVNYHHSPLPTTPSCWCWTYQVSEDDREFEKALKAIPVEASVTASGNVRPHVTHREHAYTLPNKSEEADYVAILTQQRIIGDYGQIEYETQLVERLRTSEDHELVDARGDFYLFKRRG